MVAPNSQFALSIYLIIIACGLHFLFFKWAALSLTVEISAENKHSIFQFGIPGKLNRPLRSPLLHLLPGVPFMQCSYSYCCSYHSITLWKFLALIRDFFGGSERMVQKLAGQRVSPNPFPCCCCCCLPEIAANR